MDSNVTKNTFLYKFLKLDFADKKLGLKQFLQQYLRQAINLYRQQNQIRDSWDTTIISLSNKIILRNINNHKIATVSNSLSTSFFNYWVYRCAIAFPLASHCGITPLEMAKTLVSLFPEVNWDQSTKSYIKVRIEIIFPGWIDFKINHECWGIWWQRLVLKLESGYKYQIQFDTCDKNLHLTKNPDLFLLNYYHGRCCSLLQLGERERLINLDNHNFQSLKWHISTPNPIFWFDVAETFLLTQPQELELLHSILLILDRFDDQLENQKLQDQLEVKVWLNCGLNLSNALEQFLIACRFCGIVKQQNPQLARARLGLIGVVQWCLLKLLREQLHINPIPWQEL